MPAADLRCATQGEDAATRAAAEAAVAAAEAEAAAGWRGALLGAVMRGALPRLSRAQLPRNHSARGDLARGI